MQSSPTPPVALPVRVKERMRSHFAVHTGDDNAISAIYWLRSKPGNRMGTKQVVTSFFYYWHPAERDFVIAPQNSETLPTALALEKMQVFDRNIAINAKTESDIALPEALQPSLRNTHYEKAIYRPDLAPDLHGDLRKLDEDGMPVSGHVSQIVLVRAQQAQTSDLVVLPAATAHTMSLAGPAQMPIASSEQPSFIARCLDAVRDWLGNWSGVQPTQASQIASGSQPVKIAKSKSLPKPARKVEFTYSQERYLSTIKDMADFCEEAQALLNGLKALPVGSDAAHKVKEKLKDHSISSKLDLNNLDEAIGDVDQTLDAFANLRFVGTAEYADLLQEHFKKGGDYSSYHANSCHLEETFITHRDMLLPGGCGAKSIKMIVPQGVCVTEFGWSHSEIHKVGVSELPLYASALDILCDRGFTCDNFDSITVRDLLKKAAVLSNATGIEVKHHRELTVQPSAKRKKVLPVLKNVR